jgi:hypothetical protein
VTEPTDARERFNWRERAEAAEALVVDLREQLRKESGAVHAADDAIRIHGEARRAAEARCAELETALAAADATCDRVLMDDGGNLVPEALLRAAEARCAELEHDLAAAREKDTARHD